jgi:hypothetical protein
VKRFSWMLILLLPLWAAAQTGAPPASKAPAAAPHPAPRPVAPDREAPPAPPAAEVPPTAPVITLPGLCATPAANPKDCKTVVTRAQFDTLLEAIAVGRPLPPGAKRELGTRFARMLQFGIQAEKQGLDKKPEAEELLRYARMQALAQVMANTLQKKAEPTPQEVEKYYRDNASKYQELSLARIMIPTAPPPGGKETDKAALQSLAESLRKRLAAGEDPQKLQQEAYDKIGFKNPPEAKITLRPENLPPDQQSVAQLKAGETSQVFTAPNAFFIYKSDGLKTIPLDSVRAEIQSTLQRQKFREESDAVMGAETPQFNDDYFGPPTGHGMGPRPMPPGAHPPGK